MLLRRRTGWPGLWAWGLCLISSTVFLSGCAWYYFTALHESRTSQNHHMHNQNGLIWINEWTRRLFRRIIASMNGQMGLVFGKTSTLPLNMTIEAHDDIQLRSPNTVWNDIELLWTVHDNSKIPVIDTLWWNVQIDVKWGITVPNTWKIAESATEASRRAL